MTVKEILEKVSEEVCDKLCKYSDTADEDNECEYMRKRGYCPLDKLL